MKKGFSLSEALIGIILSFFILLLIISSLKIISKQNKVIEKQDLISSLQIHQILNLATDLLVEKNTITFKYLNKEKSLEFKNNKIVMKPGTVIYYLDVLDYNFVVKENKLYLKIKRKNGEKTFLIGIL